MNPGAPIGQVPSPTPKNSTSTPITFSPAQKQSEIDRIHFLLARITRRRPPLHALTVDGQAIPTVGEDPAPRVRGDSDNLTPRRNNTNVLASVRAAGNQIHRAGDKSMPAKCTEQTIGT